MYCPACGVENDQTSVTCSNCQASLQVAFCQTHPHRAAVQACARCGTFCCDECLDPLSRRCASCVEKTGSLPWDERATLGLWVAWWRTSVAMITRPTQTLESASPEAPLLSSLAFAVLSSLVGMLPTALLYGLMLVPLMLSSSPELKLPVASALVPVLAVLYAVVLLGVQLGAFFVYASLDHLALKLFGAQPKSFAVTARAQALSMGPYLLGLIPMCGLYVFPIWALVLRILGLMHLQQVTAGKATAAVLVPLLLFCGLCGFSYLALMATAFATSLPNQ